MRNGKLRLTNSNHSVRIFLSLVFFLSWPFLIYGFGWFSSSENVLKRYLLSCTGMLMVAMSASLTRTFVERKGFSDVGWNPSHFKWYLGALLFCFSLWLGPPIVALLFDQLEWNYTLGRDELIVIILSLGSVSLLAGFGEEFGWRGYLLPRLMYDNTSARLSVLMVGIVWGIWHCAIAVGPLVKACLERTVDIGLLVRSTLLDSLLMIASSVALSFLFGALWLRTKSIFVCSFFHGYWIGIRDSASILFTYPVSFRLITLITILIGWLMSYRWLEKFEEQA